MHTQVKSEIFLAHSSDGVAGFPSTVNFGLGGRMCILNACSDTSMQGNSPDFCYVSTKNRQVVYYYVPKAFSFILH